MAFENCSNLNIVYDDKVAGNVIDPTEWNANFKEIENKENTNILNINANFAKLTANTDGSSGADNIGATPLKEGGATNVQGQLEELKAEKADKVEGKGLSTNDFTSEHKAKLDSVEQNANNYSLPTASASTLGGIKIGTGLEILEDGTVNGVSAPAPDLVAREAIAQEIIDRANADLLKQNITDNGLSTTSKQIVGAINEVNISLSEATQEACIVTVSTDNSQIVEGQIITLTNTTDNTKSETYTLLAGETSHTFRIIQNQVYKISVNAKSSYLTPSESAEFTATGGVIRNVSMQYIFVKRYGFRRTKSDSNPDTRIEYLFDAVGMTPAYMDFTSGNFNYGSWETFVNEVNRQVMLKNDGTVDYELNPNDDTKKLDGSASDCDNTAYAGNAMSAFRKYKWVYQYEDATYEYFICSNVQYDANYKAYAFQNALGHIQDEFYWGKYKGTNVSSKLRSIGTGEVMVRQTRNTEVAYAQANGTGHYTIYKSGWDYIGNLLTLISKSDNSQAKFGTGRSKDTNTTAIATGTLKALPRFKGYNDETSDVKVFGIEGFYGNVWEGMAGLLTNASTQILTKLTPPYNFDGSGYVNTTIVPSGTNGGFINTTKVDGEMGFIPKTANGSGTTYYCDGLWFVASCYALVGGTWDYGLRVGSRYVNLYNASSFVYTNIGSRLSFLNPA